MESLVISIITVCYNSANTIEQTIRSVLSQSYQGIEYVIIDGGSTDGTKEIIKRYINEISIFISEPDKGIYDAMNKGIKVATGDVISILNSDDIFISDSVITKVAEAFLAHKTDVVYGNIVMSKNENINKHVREWIAGKRASFVWGWHPPHPGLFVRKSLYLSYGFYNSRYFVSADFDLMLRLFEVHKVTSYYLNEFLVNMRMGGESTGSLKGIIAGNINIRKAFKANDVRYVWIYPCIRIWRKLLQYL